MGSFDPKILFSGWGVKEEISLGTSLSFRAQIDDLRHFRWFGICSCKPAPRGLPSSLVQPRGAIPKINADSYGGRLKIME